MAKNSFWKLRKKPKKKSSHKAPEEAIPDGMLMSQLTPRMNLCSLMYLACCSLSCNKRKTYSKQEAHDVWKYKKQFSHVCTTILHIKHVI